ncbi:MAG: hypothetical protein QXH24_06595 [Candidatus Bathyarchaeia archaeon]
MSNSFNTGLIGEWNIGYVDITGSTSPLHIGSFAYGNGYNFKGVVDNVAIYSRALSWTELASLRDNNPPSSGLIALWRLDEMQVESHAEVISTIIGSKDFTEIALLFGAYSICMVSKFPL